MFKILSWNIQQGGGSRVSEIVQSLFQQYPDVIALSEFRNNERGDYIRNKLLKFSYRYQLVSAAPNTENSVAVFSKYPFNGKLFNTTEHDFKHNILCCNFEAFKLLAVYLPHKKRHRLFEILKEEVMTGLPSVIVGDFNTGYNFIDQKGDSFWYTDQLRILEREGMIDAFRLKNGEIEEFSWFSHQGNGYRYDHSWIGNSLSPIVSECYYLHKWREEKISDHSAMVLTLA